MAEEKEKMNDWDIGSIATLSIAFVASIFFTLISPGFNVILFLGSYLFFYTGFVLLKNIKKRRRKKNV